MMLPLLLLLLFDYIIVRMYSVSTCGRLIVGFVVVALCAVFVCRFCSSFDESMMLILNSALFLGQANFRHVNEIYLSENVDVLLSTLCCVLLLPL